MALSSRNVFILLSVCLSASLVNSQQYQRYQRFGRQVQDRPQNRNPQAQPQRRMRPMKRVGAVEPRFDNFEPEINTNFGKRPNFRPDGAEYDEYGNRQTYQQPRGYGQQSRSSNPPPQQENLQENRPQRPRPRYPAPKRTVDNKRKAVIDEVDPSVLRELEEARPQGPVQAAQPRQDLYEPASGPAFASPSNLSPIYADARNDLAAGALEASVIAGANAYGGVAKNPDGVYQNEERLSFQIHGQEGPHSYRYGYDTGSGYNRQFRYEERTGEGYVKGRYGFYDKYGVLQVINYTADPVHGFHAEGANVPKYPH